MMTPKMKEDFCTQILGASRQALPFGQDLRDLPGKRDAEAAGVSSGTAAGGIDSPG